MCMKGLINLHFSVVLFLQTAKSIPLEHILASSRGSRQSNNPRIDLMREGANGLRAPGEGSSCAC